MRLPLTASFLAKGIRLLWMVLSGHRHFAQAAEILLQRYRYFNSREYSSLSLEELISELRAIGQSIADIARGHMGSIVVSELLFAALSALIPPALVSALTRGSNANKTVAMNERFRQLCVTASQWPTVR